jgi:hypothetical protein
MKHRAQNRLKALTSACVLAMTATVAWSQPSLGWALLGGDHGARLLVFPPMAPWWSAWLTTPQGCLVPFAGRRMGGMQDLGTLGGEV